MVQFLLSIKEKITAIYNIFLDSAFNVSLLLLSGDDLWDFIFLFLSWKLPKLFSIWTLSTKRNRKKEKEKGSCLMVGLDLLNQYSVHLCNSIVVDKFGTKFRLTTYRGAATDSARSVFCLFSSVVYIRLSIAGMRSAQKNINT